MAFFQHRRQEKPLRSSNEQMIQQQIVARGITTPAVIEAFRRTDRGDFVPDDQVEHAYDDHPIPLGPGSTVSQPFIVALMTDLLAVEPQHRVLEIGSGSGYQAAILALLAERVYGVEIQAELVQFARTQLRRLDRNNVLIIHGNGWAGYEPAAPYDRIIITAAPTEPPSDLINQLAPGGRMVAPIGPDHSQELYIIDKSETGKISRTSHSPVRFVPLIKSVALLEKDQPYLKDQ